MAESYDATPRTNLDDARNHALSGGASSLVHAREEGVGGLRDEGGGETGDETGREVERGLGALGELGRLLAGGRADLLKRNLVDGELGHGVGDLLEEDGTETSVEATDTLLLEDAAEAAGETGRESRVGDKTDTDGLKRL
jgi:hypothetical protein